MNVANLSDCYLSELKVLSRSLKFFLQAHVAYVTLKIALNVQDHALIQHDLFVLICMLAQLYVFLIKQLPILSTHFINAWIYNHYIRYQALHKLFLSICMAVLTIHLSNLTVNIANS